MTPTELPEVLEIEPRVLSDSRGFFLESYQQSRYAAAGIEITFVQDNHSHSVHGVIRGLHYQLTPGQSKLVRCIRGEVADVVVDIRRGSPRYGQWMMRELSETNKHQLFIPAGFAHGFCVLSGEADVAYKVDSYYDPVLERGIRYDDPELAIAWPVDSPILSDRDAALPSLADAENDFCWQAS